MARYLLDKRRAAHLDDLPAAPVTRQGLGEIGRLAAYVKPYRWQFAAALSAVLVSSLCGLAYPYFAGRLANAALANRGGAPRSWLEDVDLAALALVGVLSLQAVCAFFRAVSMSEVGERSLADLRRDLYGRLVRLPMAFHARRRVGELAGRLAADLAQIQEALTVAFPQTLRQAVLFAGGLVLISMTSLHLTLVMLATFPPLVIAAVVFGRLLRRYSRQAQDRLADGNVVVEETLQNIAGVKAFTNEGYEDRRYAKSLDEFLAVTLWSARLRGAFMSFVIFAVFGAVVLVLWYGMRLVWAGSMAPGQLTSFMLYTLFIAGALGSVAELYSQLQRTVGATHRIRELLTEKPEPLSEVRPARARLRGEVAFEGVTFSYPSRPGLEVLRDVSLGAGAGQRVALVGPSGAGKSTLVALLLRFYEPDGGRILLDGRDAREYDLAFVRSQVAVVPQDVVLFGGTILENIAYGRPGASDAEVVEAARLANADEFIRTFPEGYQTRVGERGVQLSGGQRQRVAIARAILRDPAILVLDEATSALDSASERLVWEALDRLMRGRTSLVIAHRLSTVRGADRIYVISEGRTVESGTHAELLARDDGLYRMLCHLQLGHAEEQPADAANGRAVGQDSHANTAATLSGSES
jgi:ATP-binding cassette subfamily B protein